MEIINQKIKFNPDKLYRLIAKQVGIDLNGLSEPCYEVRTKVFEAKVYRELGVSKKEMADFAKRTVKGTKGEKNNVIKVPFTFTLAYIYYRFVKANKQKMAEDILLYTLIKHYGSRLHTHLPIKGSCNNDIFRYTIQNITKTHLFYREKTIANALLFLSKVVSRRYYLKIKNNDWDPELIVKYMVESRHRVAQSLKSFMQAYYRYREEGKVIKTQMEPGDEDQRNLYQTTTANTGKVAAIDKFIKNMFIYKSQDQKAVDEAKRVSRVKSNLAETLISSIHDKSSEENIKIILHSFLKEIIDTKSLCSPDFFKIVKKLMMVRKYKDTYLFINLVIQFTDSLLDSTSLATRKLTQRDKVSLYLFVAFYITISFRNLFC